jgi:hypothetical protein
MSRVLLLGFKHPVSVVFAVLAITLLAAPRARNIRLDVSANLLTSPGSPEQAALEELEERFGVGESAVVYVEDPRLLTPDKLQQLRALHDALARLPFVQRISSLCTILDLREVDGALELAPLIGSKPPATDEAAREKRGQIGSHSMLQKSVVSLDGTATALTLHLDKRVTRESGGYAALRTTQQIDSALRQFNTHFAELFQLGTPRVQAEIVESLKNDLTWLLPLACGCLVLVLAFTLRSAIAAILPVLLAGIAGSWTLGAMAAFDLPVTLLNSMLPILVLVIGAAEDTHLYHEFLGNLRREPDRLTAFHATARRMALPMSLTTSTTLLGFASTALADMPIVRNFGLCAAIALSLRFLLSFTLLPAMFRLLAPLFERVARHSTAGAHADGMAKWIVSRVVPKARLVIAALCIVSIAAIAAAWHIEPSNNLLSHLRRDSPVVRQTHHAAAMLAGMTTISLEIAGKPESFLQPRELARLHELCRRIGGLRGVDTVTSFADAIARVHQQLHGGTSLQFRVPDSTAAIRQMLLFVDPAEFSELVTADYSAVHVRIRTPIENSAVLNRLIERIRGFVAGSDFAAQPFKITGSSVVVAAAVDSITGAQVTSLGATTVLTFAIVALLFLSTRCGAINLIVNLFSIVVCFGVMGIAGIPLNAGTCMVAAITLGIAVDDTLHLLVRFNREVSQLKNERRGIEAALRAEVRPILATTLGLAGGFAVLALSSLEPVRQFGALSAGVLLLAMATDFFVTPVFFANTRLVTLWEVLGLQLRQSLLENSAFFRGLNSWQARRVILASIIEKYQPGDFIVRDGELGSTMYVIIGGEAEVWNEQSGVRRQLARLGIGESFGEVALVSQRPRVANVSALTATSVLVLNQETLRSLSRFSPYLAAHLFLNIAKIIGDRLAKLIDQSAADPQHERIEHGWHP